MSPTSLEKRLKETTSDDKGLTRSPVVTHVSPHKDEVRSIAHGYFQSQFRVPVYKEVDRLEEVVDEEENVEDTGASHPQ